VIRSSVIPSEKYSCSISPDMLTKGSMAIDGLLGSASTGSPTGQALRRALPRWESEPVCPYGLGGDVVECLLSKILEGA
jgi:hypothetical protein